MFVKESCIYLGKIIRTHGIHGQLVVATKLSFNMENIKEPILVELDGGLVPFYLASPEGVRFRDHQSYLIRFDHVEKKEQAAKYVGCELYLLFPPDDIEEDSLLSEPSLLKHFSIYDDNNSYLGKVNDVLDFSGNTLLSVYIKDKEVLLPFTEAHILSWDTTERKIQLYIPEGLLEI